MFRHNEIQDLEAELLVTVCKDVEVEPLLQQLSGENLNNGANTSPDARLDIHARGFWERQRSAYFDVRVVVNGGYKQSKFNSIKSGFLHGGSLV